MNFNPKKQKLDSQTISQINKLIKKDVKSNMATFNSNFMVQIIYN